MLTIQTVSCDGFSARTHARRTLQFSAARTLTHVCVFPKFKAHAHTHVLKTANVWRKILIFFLFILFTNLNSGTIRPWKSIENIVAILSSCIFCPKTCKKQCGNEKFWSFLPKNVRNCDRTSHTWKMVARTHIAHTFQKTFRTHIAHMRVFVCEFNFATHSLGL